MEKKKKEGDGQEQSRASDENSDCFFEIAVIDTACTKGQLVVVKHSQVRVNRSLGHN